LFVLLSTYNTMEQELTKRARRTSAEIRNLLVLFSKTDMPTKDFCMLPIISEVGFYKWRTRYVNKSTAKENNFVLLHEASESKDGSMLFGEVKGIRF
jgi:hypothetical protein